MGTVLDTPVQTGSVVTTQKITQVTIDLKNNQLRMTVSGADSGDDRVNGIDYRQPIFDDVGTVILPPLLEASGRTFLQDLTTIAKGQGWIGSGITTDDL